MGIGDRIKQFRKKLGLTQYDLAEAINISVDTVRRWESEKQTPRAGELMQICNVLGCTESDLLNGPVREEFEVKILIGVKSMNSLAGVAVSDNTFFYGVDDVEPQIHLAGKVRIDTPEERAKARDLILSRFDMACWMFDHRTQAEKETLQ